MPDPAPVMAAADTPMTPAQAQMGEALLMGEAALDNSLLGRMQRVELALLRLEADFQAIRPSIERLVAVEADLDELVDQLFMLVAQGQGAVAPPAPVAPAAPAGVPVQQQAAGAPVPLVPVGDGGVTELTPAACSGAGSRCATRYGRRRPHDRTICLALGFVPVAGKRHHWMERACRRGPWAIV